MGKRERDAIIRDCGALNVDKEQLESMYNYCVGDTNDIQNFLLIDKSAKQGFNFRKNLNQILNIDDF